MNELFNIPLTYKGTELEFKGRIERWGYTHRVAVLIGEETYVFEPDEEGGYRVLADPAKTSVDIEVALLASVAEKLAKLITMN